MKRAILPLLLLALASPGCADRRAACCPCPAEGKLSKALMLHLATVRSLHHKADVQLGSGDIHASLTTVREILKLKPDSSWPEAEEARLDATARLATLLLQIGEASGALEEVERGLRSSTRESFYLSNLHSLRGELLEAKVKTLDSAGKKDEARALAREAIAAFEASIAINKRLQEKLGKGAVTEEATR